MNNKNFYLLYSDDKAILNKEIEKVKKKINVNEDSIIYYDIENINDIIEEALTISMFGDIKLLIINSTSFLSEKKEITNINLLEDYLERYNENSYLIFISYKDNIDSRKKLVKLISGNGITKKVEASEENLSIIDCFGLCSG